MEELVLDIVAALRARPDGSPLSERELQRLIRAHNRGVADSALHASKRELLAFCLRVRRDEPERWRSWGLAGELGRRLVATLRVKPGRSASGVASVSCLTPAWPCSGGCAFCPQDLRMPKSYLADEPACRRAEQCLFDPYLQAASRLRALHEMGHEVGEVELAVLGGSWTDYPAAYRRWFVSELYRAASDWPDVAPEADRRRAALEARGITADPAELARRVAGEQALVDAGALGYNEAVRRIVGRASEGPATSSSAVLEEGADAARLAAARLRNEGARCRVVGLSLETRPDAVTPSELCQLLALGCTRLQLGVQSTRQDLRDANARGTTGEQLGRAFALARLFGLTVHAHLMANLVGATPASDADDYRALVADPSLMPDEVKLYPVALVAGTRLARLHEEGRWEPYDHDTLVELLAHDLLATPAYVRISRMVRDIPAPDIVAGNRRGNLRQEVEALVAEQGRAGEVAEMRFRERHASAAGRARRKGPGDADDVVAYETVVSHERLLRTFGPDGRLVAYLRLTLPRWDAIARGETPVREDELPVGAGVALVRELRVREGDEAGDARRARTHGLVRRAGELAGAAGMGRLVVAPAPGARPAWREAGFSGEGPWLSLALDATGGRR